MKALNDKDVDKERKGVFMRRLVLASHGNLAKGMKNSAQIIAGTSMEIHTICAYVTEGVKLESQIEELFGSFNEDDEIIVVTDIFGGSVNNEFMQWLGKKHFLLIAGMTLPLVVQLMMLKEGEYVPEKIAKEVENAKEMICFCNPMEENVSEEQEDF